MITNGIITLVVAVLQPIMSLFPTVDLTPLTNAVSGAGTIGAYLGHANFAVPVTEMLSTLLVFVTLLPVVLAYVVGNWIWRHIPMIGGFGTGGGG